MTASAAAYLTIYVRPCRRHLYFSQRPSLALLARASSIPITPVIANLISAVPCMLGSCYSSTILCYSVRS